MKTVTEEEEDNQETNDTGEYKKCQIFSTTLFSCLLVTYIYNTLQ